MNKDELKIKLASIGVRPDAYSLDGGFPNECYVLNKESDNRWATYYSERGQKSGLRFFDSESAACQFLLEELIQDSTTSQT